MKHILRTCIACILCHCLQTGHAPAAEPEGASVPDMMAKAEAAAKAGRIAEADTQMENVLATLRKEAGIDHPSVGMTLSKQGYYRMHTQRFAEAATSFAEATALLEKSLGRENPAAFGTRYQWINALRKSNNAAAAADVARHLLQTLTTLSTSGRARLAGWDAVGVSPNQRAQWPVKADEAGIADVESTLALCLVEAGKTDEAAPLLASALAATGKLYGQGHPRGVALQQAIEKIALARGEAIGRRHVGGLTLTKSLTFEGNNGFPATDLIHGLARNQSVVLASHPAAAFPGFLDAIQSALVRGYRAAGYPDVRVAMRYANAPDKAPGIIAAVTEGPRFLSGSLTVNGAPQDLANNITRFLTKDTSLVTRTLGQRINDAIEAASAPAEKDAANRAADLAEAATNADTDATPDHPTNAMMQKEMQMMKSRWTGGATTVWESGTPMDFEDASTIPQAIQAALTASGHPMARWNHHIENRASGTCDLVVTIDDPGPLAVLGTIKVTGNKKNPADKIIGLTGLKPGEPLLPEHLAAARLALWDTGRFWPFAILAKPADGAKHIDVVITVNELDKAPALDVAPSTPQAIALRAARTINESFATRGIRVAGTKGGTSYEIACDPDGTLAAKLTKAQGGQTILMAMDRGVLRCVIKDISSTACFDLPVGRFVGMLNILPTYSLQEQWHIGLSLLWNARGFADGGQATFDFLASPAFAFLTDLDMTVKDDRMILSSKGIEQFTVDTATGGLVTIAGLPVTSGDNMIKPLLGEIDKAMKAAGGKSRSITWPDMLARVLASSLRDMREHNDKGSSPEMPQGLENIPAAMGSYIVGLLPAARDLSPKQIDAIERVTARLLGILTANDGEESTSPIRFNVPADTGTGQNTTLHMLLGMGFVQLSEQFLPSDTWMATLSRELLFSMSGNHLYTAAVMSDLLADPEMGPLGSLLAARVIDLISPAHVRFFEEKALRQCNAAGFRHDWELAMRGDTGISRTTIHFFDAMAALTPADEADIILLLGPDRTTWFKDFLAALRARPAGQSLADCVAPHMDKLWDQHLGPRISKALDARLHPPVDTARVAAIVNGKPLSRALVQLAQRVGNPLPDATGSKPDLDPWKLARRDLIRLMLAREEYLANGGTIDPTQVEKIFLGMLPKSFAAADDASLQKSCGISREEALLYTELRVVSETVAQNKLATLQVPSAGDIARWQAGPGAGMFDEFHVHWWKTAGPDASPFHGQILAMDRLCALRALLTHGMPADIIAMASARDHGRVVEFQCQKALPIYGMHAALAQAMESIPSGGVSQPVMAGGKFYLLLPVARKPGTPLADGSAAAIISSRVASAQQKQRLGTWLADLEKHADIKIIDGPEPDDKAWIAASLLTAESWKSEHAESLIARLIVFWCAVHGADKDAAAQCLADLTREPTLDAKAMEKLADATKAAGQEGIAKQLRDKAATLPKPVSEAEK